MALNFGQAHASAISSPSTPGVIAFVGNCTPGTVLFCSFLLASSGATAQVTGISDPTNGAWSVIPGCSTTFAGSRIGVYFVRNTASTALTVSIAFSGTGTLLNPAIAEYSGPNTTLGPIDASGIALDLTNTSYVGTPVTTTYTNETVIAMGYSAQTSGTCTGTNGFTSRITVSGTSGSMVLDATAATAGVYTPKATLSVSSEMALATFSVLSTTSVSASGGGGSSSWLTVALANGLRGVRH